MAKRKRKQIDNDLKQTREKLAKLEAEAQRADMTPEQEAAQDKVEHLQKDLREARKELRELRSA